MYQQHFDLRELPFSIAPDPRFLYMSAQHREALAHLAYGMNAEGGFILLTGEVGMGKTTVCRCLLDQIPENVDVAFILNPKMTVEELLATICDELGIMYPQGNTSVKIFIDRINSYLLDAFAGGRKTILIIEEAQHLDAEVLEQIRLLTNLETSRQKLLQIIMIGQPELREILSRPEMLPLSQRITARYHIGPLPKNEISAYVRHRLSVAGAQGRIFPDSLSGILYRLSGGIPRLINVICDRALLGAYVQGKGSVDRKTLLKAAQEVLGQHEVNRYRKRKMRWMAAGFVLVFCGAAIAGAVYHYKGGLPVFTPEVVSKETAGHTEMNVADRLEWPSEKPLESSKHSAYEAIFQEWNIQYEKKVSGDICRQALGNGLDSKLSSIEDLKNGSWIRSNDDDLVRRVKKFQLAAGLVPDGIVGSHAIILLNNKSGSDEPLLTRNSEVH
jgi:general secretion pathway protein A